MKLRKRTLIEWLGELNLDWGGVLVIVGGLSVVFVGIFFVRREEPAGLDFEKTGTIVNIVARVAIRPTKYGNVSDLKGWQMKWEYFYGKKKILDSAFVWRIQLNKEQQNFVKGLHQNSVVTVKYKESGKSFVILR